VIRIRNSPIGLTMCSEARALRSFGHRFARHKPTGSLSDSCAPSRSECFDWLLILNQQHLNRVLQAFVDDYKGHRPHRALSLTPPEPRRPAATVSASGDARVLRRDRLGGVVHEHVLAA